MSAVLEQTVLDPVASEWTRIELLGHCLSEVRQGRELSDDLLARLRAAQRNVDEGRQRGDHWGNAFSVPLSTLEYDLLACAVAPEAEPRLGWMFQSLQLGTPQPYPTPALVQDLFALDACSANELYAALAEEGSLRRGQLLILDGDDPYQPFRPGPGVTARVLGRPEAETAPPGAQRIHAQAEWDELVLPKERIAELWEFLWWIQHRDRVIGEWGGKPTGGPVALFSGPSGTGKTFAASVLASALQWPLYRVDLGRLVSKYIGETEKNLNRLFDAAHGRPMLLQFDEADALFGKRGEIKEARDRYANMEVSHLLARVESHRGPCILTTNLRDSVDPAFARRLQMIVEFPRPDVAARTRLWSQLLPPRAPCDSDVDPAFLARAVNLTGGGIRNAALHAAYIAAGTDRPIGLEALAVAAWRELAKDGRELSLVDLGPLADYFPEGGQCSA